MSALRNFGYLLAGVGIGTIATSILYRRELSKPIGEEIEYVSQYPDEEDEDDFSDNQDGWSSNSRRSSAVPSHDRAGSQERYSSGSGRGSGRDSRGRRDTREQEFGTNQTNVVNVYGQRQKDIAHSVGQEHFEGPDKRDPYERSKRKRENDTPYSKMYRNQSNPADMIYEAEIDSSVEEDVEEELPIIEQDIHRMYNLERVEANFEIFIGDNPQDFVTVVFYKGDKTLCDEDEQIIPYPEEVVGMVALNRLMEGGPGTDGDVIFVRNLRTCINYEVVLDLGCYSQTVLGLFENHLNSDGGKGANTQ